MENATQLLVEELTVSISSRRILRDVRFEVLLNKTLCLVGESGSGKTTCALALMGLLSEKAGFSSTGKALFDGQNLIGMSQRKFAKLRGTHLAMIFQDPASSLNPVFSIAEQLAECFELHTALSEDEIEMKMFDLLESVGLKDQFDPFETYPHQLSGGMKQRVCIAMGIALSPKLLLCDEPTSSLDLTVQKECLTLLKSFSCSKLVITHDFGVVAMMADTVAVMYAGQIVEYGTALEVFEGALHPYTKALLGARPSLQTRKKMLPTVPYFTSADEVKRLSPTHWVRAYEKT